MSGGFTEGREGWKEEFLLQITGKYGNGELLKFEDNKYRLIGLPLFNKSDEVSFENEFNKHVLY
jgi:type III restriction enzyme